MTQSLSQIILGILSECSQMLSERSLKTLLHAQSQDVHTYKPGVAVRIPACGPYNHIELRPAALKLVDTLHLAMQFLCFNFQFHIQTSFMFLVLFEHPVIMMHGSLMINHSSTHQYLWQSHDKPFKYPPISLAVS